MTPEKLTPDQALASAYVDGDVTVVERARVEASPELLALVASMRHAATLIATVAPPTNASREVGLAAALAEFDSRGSSTDNVVSLANHRRWPTRVLTAAAAVILVGVVGITVLRNDTKNDNNSDSASLATDTNSETTKRSDTGVAEDAVAGAQPVDAGDEVVLQAAASTIEINDPQDLSTLVPATPPADTSPVADTTAGAGETSATAERFDSYNIDALSCMSDSQFFLADIYYRGALAIAVRDTVTGVTEAIDGNCTVLARVNP